MAFSVGPLVVRPKLAVSESYNDNLFFANQNQEAAFITDVTPGIDLRLGRLDADRVFRLNYTFNQYWFHGAPEIDTAQAHNLSLTGTIKGERLSSDTSFSLGLMNTIYGGYEAFSQGAVVGSRNIERLTYGVTESLRYRVSDKTSAYGRFTLSELDFRAVGTYYDQNVWQVLGGVGYQLRPKVQLLSELYYGQTASNPNVPYSAWLDGLPNSLPTFIYTVKPAHMETVGGYLGATLAFTTKLTGTVKLGYEQSDRKAWIGYPEVGPSLIAAGSGPVSVGAPVVGASLTSAITERTSATLSYNRKTGASVQTTATVYTGDNFNLQLRHVMGTAHPWIFTLGGNYGLNQYEPYTRLLALTVPGSPPVVTEREVPGSNSDFLGANVGVTYQPQPWLGASLGYRYSNSKTSTGGGSVDYSVNEVYFAVNIGY